MPRFDISLRNNSHPNLKWIELWETLLACHSSYQCPRVSLHSLLCNISAQWHQRFLVTHCTCCLCTDPKERLRCEWSRRPDRYVPLALLLQGWSPWHRLVFTGLNTLSWTVKVYSHLLCLVCVLVYLAALTTKHNPVWLCKHRCSSYLLNTVSRTDTLSVTTPIPVLSLLCSSGDAETAASFARQLLAMGADPNLRSRWTNMRALHYAAYFDVPQLIRVVLQASQPGGERIAAAGCWQKFLVLSPAAVGINAPVIYLFLINILRCRFIRCIHRCYI